jgi:HEAT repeat protein
MRSGSFIFPQNPGQTLTVEVMEEAYRKSPAGLRAQIGTDRYYAVHLLGRLGDSKSVDALVPLLSDDDVNYNVAWALGEIGDPRAIPPLIVALQNPDALVRVSAINALEKMHAREALPHLRALFEDTSLPSAGDQVSVGTAARTTFYKLQYEASKQ